MRGSDPMFIPPALHELESEVMEDVCDAVLVHFARRMDQLDPERRQQLNDLAHRA